MSAVSKNKSQSTWEQTESGLVRTKTYEDGRRKITSFFVGELLGIGGLCTLKQLNPEKDGKTLAIKSPKMTSKHFKRFEYFAVEREYKILLDISEKCPSFQGYLKGFIPKSETQHPVLIIRQMNKTWKDLQPSDIFEWICAVKDLASQLKELHSAGITHVDIANDNIMYHETRKKYFLVDFGCSKRNDECKNSTDFTALCEYDIQKLIGSTKPAMDSFLARNPKIMCLWNIVKAPKTIDELLKKIQAVIDYLGYPCHS
jgi:serine/threonine protein kinase